MEALVIGGTGPTGKHVIEGLINRHYDVTLLHRGLHEDRTLPDVPHIHADPHVVSSLTSAINSMKFDLVVATYGRLKVIGDVLANRCKQLVCVGGVPVYRGLIAPETNKPYGMKLFAEETSPLADDCAYPPDHARRVVDAERSVFEHSQRNEFKATVVRYPLIYGPRNVIPWEWAIIKRLLDGRRRMILPDDGLWIMSRCAARNAAEALLCAVDNPNLANGKAYNCADNEQLTVRQWAESVVSTMGLEMEFVGIPSQLAPSALAELLPADIRPHMLVDATRIQRELGYQQIVSTQDALKEVVLWLLDNPVTRSEYPLYRACFDYQHEDKLIDAYQLASKKVQAMVPDSRPPMPHSMREATLTSNSHNA